MKKIFSYLRPFAGAMSLGLFIKFIGTIMDLLLPWILAYIIDTAAPRQDAPQIWMWGGVMLVCSILAVVTNIWANRMASRVARDSVRTLRRDLFEKTIRLSGRQIDSLTIPSLEARLTTDTYQVHQMIGMMQRLGVRAPILLIGGILVTMTLEPVLSLTLVCILPFIALVVWQVSRKGVPLYTRLQQGVDGLIRVIRENITGIRVVKALSKGDYEKRRFDGANKSVAEMERKAAATMALTNPLMNALLNLGLTLVIIVGAFRVNLGISQPGKIIAFLSYFTIILNAMMIMTRLFVMYSRGSASASRIAEVLDLPEELAVIPDQAAPGAAPGEPAHIAFDHVSFSYNGRRDTLTDISFTLRRGETLGIIGATGSGKSTLLNLLMRLYDASGGEIRIDGRPIQAIPKDALHTMFGVVFQHDALFAETLSENIDFGRGLPRETIEHAAQMAQAAEFIAALPDGLAHPLTSRGTNVSGGQKQRILISRALAGKPHILILDDASSSLDYRTDAALRRALRENFSGVTTLIVAQRVSSILHADQILVLEHGAMLGLGTHAQLMETCELYREIYFSQMGGGANAESAARR
ncbi:MAG: ABC transporter ATP-binding protein/permease [Firmicutes bacterium]|nr:ABC transporter ATP-binding protein/permease [Bacillota bacterium]